MNPFTPCLICLLALSSCRSTGLAPNAIPHHSKTQSLPASRAEYLHVISRSPDGSLRIAVVYDAKPEFAWHRKTFPNKANYGSKPLVLIDTRTGNRRVLAKEEMAEDIHVTWVKKHPVFTLYRRDEKLVSFEVYRITHRDQQSVEIEPVEFPSVVALAQRHGDDPGARIDQETEFLDVVQSCENPDKIDIDATTCLKSTRRPSSDELSYAATFRTQDYKTFELLQLRRDEESMPPVILYRKDSATSSP